MELPDTAAPDRARSSVAAGDFASLASAGCRDGRVALVAGERLFDYAQLASEVDAVCALLAQRGVGGGSLVALAAERDAETIVAILALLRMRAAYLPLDLSYPRERLVAILEDARPQLAIGTVDALARMPAFDVPHCAFTLFTSDSANDSRGFRPSHSDSAPPRSPYPLGTGTSPRIADAPGNAPGIAGGCGITVGGAKAPTAPPRIAANSLQGEALAYVLFTSGSTGRPKGVAMRRAPLEHLISWHVAHPRLGLPARTLQFAPLSFDVHFQEIASTFATGGTLVLVDDATRRNPAALLALLREQRIERLFLPYVALHGLAEAARDHGAHGLVLRDVVSAGEALRVTPAIRALFAQLPGAALHNHYGPTETHVVTAATLEHDADAWPELPDIGAPLPHVEIAFADDGGLLLGGDCLAAGYVGRPELTAERFIERGGTRWYVTGDRVERRPGGALAYLGRLDQQLKIGGFRVEPGEVELALLELPQVRAAAVAARALDDGAPALVAWIVARADGGANGATRANEVPGASGASRATEEILATLRARLPPYLVPARIMSVDSLPTTASGKIDYAALPAPRAAFPFPSDASATAVICALWCEELGLLRLESDANVFDAGASSLAVARFVAALAQRSRYVLGIADVYAAPTVRALASRTQFGALPSNAAAQQRGARQRDALDRWRNSSGARA